MNSFSAKIFLVALTSCSMMTMMFGSALGVSQFNGSAFFSDDL
jgi:hypothetical protein